MRLTIYIIIGAAVLFGSFFITLWLTEPSVTRGLEGQRISNYSDLPKAAQNVGLSHSEELKGFIDVISRINEREVNITGWLADPLGDSTPLNVMVFINGAMVATTQTKGERADITKAFHLGPGAEKNVVFSLNFDCKPGAEPVIVGIGNRRQYVELPPKQCP
jgi:hypothetical protein